MDDLKVLAITGGGMRGMVVPGVLQAGIDKRRVNMSNFHVFTGDSFGALLAVLFGCGWSPDDVQHFLEGTDVSKLLSPIPWAVRKPMLAVKPVSLDGVAAFIDKLNLPPREGIFINAWDISQDCQVIFCETKPDWAVDNPAVKTVWVEKAFSELGYGKCVARSMSLLVLQADDPKWFDGGVGEHPPVSFLPVNSSILCVNLGYAGLIDYGGTNIPKGVRDRALYAIDVMGYNRQQYALTEFPHMIQVDPEAYHIDTMAMDMPARGKYACYQHGYNKTLDRWNSLPIGVF